MNREYKIKSDEFGTVIWFEENGSRISFLEKPGNRHYEEYLEWVAEGNTAEVVEPSA